jgi:hypothetical protein
VVDEPPLSTSGDLPNLSNLKFHGTLADAHRNTNQIRLFEALFTNYGNPTVTFID